MSNNKVEVMGAVRAAADFARKNVRHTAGVLALVMVLNVAGDLGGRNVLLSIVVGVGTVLAGVMANAALLRLAFADEHPGDPDFRIGPQGFQWGRTEIRLLGAILLVALFFVLALLVLLLLAVVAAIATMALGHPNAPIPTPQTPLPPAGQLAISVLVTLFVLAGLWVAVRICVYPAATVAEKRVQVFSTWALTRGHFASIFAALVLVLAPAMILAVGIEACSAFPAVQGVLALVFAAVSAFVVGPMVTGLYAHLYRILRVAQIPRPAPLENSSALAGPWGSV